MDSRSAGEKSPSGPISIQIDLISLKSSEVKFFWNSRQQTKFW